MAESWASGNEGTKSGPSVFRFAQRDTHRRVSHPWERLQETLVVAEQPQPLDHENVKILVLMKKQRPQVIAVHLWQNNSPAMGLQRHTCYTLSPERRGL